MHLYLLKGQNVRPRGQGPLLATANVLKGHTRLQGTRVGVIVIEKVWQTNLHILILKAKDANCSGILVHNIDVWFIHQFWIVSHENIKKPLIYVKFQDIFV